MGEDQPLRVQRLAGEGDAVARVAGDGACAGRATLRLERPAMVQVPQPMQLFTSIDMPHW